MHSARGYHSGMSTATHTGSSVKPSNSGSATPKRIFNFSAGPGYLPESVIKQAQQDLWEIDGTGIGIAEHSHRGKLFDRVLAEAEADCRKIANIPANYKVLFLTGGATSQNFMVPANLLPDNGAAAYLTTGYWAEKSFEESKFYSGNVYEGWDGRGCKHDHCPTDAEITYKGEKPAYVHMCSNNTIYGTQWRNADGTFRYPKMPDASVPLVCDMSSDIYSRPFDVSRFGLIYAGAQKNLGVAGTTIVIVREDLLKPVRKLPVMLRYETHAKDGSRHNTPPVFPIYVSGLVFKWILAQGGLEKMLQANLAKTKPIFDILDSSKFYKGHARPDSRSPMNITFRTPNEQLDELFAKEAFKQGMDQLKGHRATGGIRASTYNAFPAAGCKAMAEFMREFERTHG